jgi:ABC-type Fe3+ transport system substrate-binding protein
MRSARTRTIDRRGALVLAAAAPFAWAGTDGAAAADELDDLYDAARGEGALTMYTGGAASNSAATIRAFNARYPGIAVTVVGAYSNVNDVKIDRQLRAGDVSADIVSFQTIQDFVRWQRAGELLPYKFPGFEQFAARYTDPDGAFVATSLSPLTYAYNTQLVRPEAVPRSALDFLAPAFAGHAITCYPHDDDATLYLYWTLAQHHGWDFIDRYMKSGPAFVEGHLGVVNAIAAGRKRVTFDCSAHMVPALQAKGAPIEARFSPRDPTPVFYNTSAILRAAPHPNAAKLFTAWSLSREQLTRSGNWTARRDVPTPPGARPLSAYRLADGYRAFLTDEPLVRSLRTRFLAYTGPVVNRS